MRGTDAPRCGRWGDAAVRGDGENGRANAARAAGRADGGRAAAPAADRGGSRALATGRARQHPARGGRRQGSGLPEPEKLLQTGEQARQGGHDEGVNSVRNPGAVLPRGPRSDAQAFELFARSG